jgi:hypothetical protein
MTDTLKIALIACYLGQCLSRWQFALAAVFHSRILLLCRLTIRGDARLTMANIWTKNMQPESLDDVMLVDMPDFLMLDGVDDIPQRSKTEKTISVSQTDLLNDGSRWNGNGHQEKQCTTSGDWIDLGKVDTGEAALINHEGKRRCLAKLERNKQIQESAAAEEALDDLRWSGTVSPHTCRSRRVALYSPLSSVSFVSGTISST